MALKSLSTITVLALLAFSSLFGMSTAFGSRKILATAPAPSSDSEIEFDPIGLAPLPADVGFTPLDTKDQKVIGLARFAVDDYNKANKANLVFSHVLEAVSTTTAQETKYGLALLATSGKDLNTYLVDISDVKGVEKLISFVQGQ